MAYLTQYSSSVPVIKFNIEKTHMTIGQNIEMDICVPDDNVAESHAMIEAFKQAGSYRFVINSHEEESLLNLNGETVSRAELRDGDWLMIGGVEFQFTDDGIYNIKEKAVATLITSSAEIKKSPQSNKENKAPAVLNLVKDEVKPMTTKEFIAASRFSRRLNLS